MITVGLTGSVGSGKSTVSSFFKDLGAYIIDWDDLARNVTRPHLEAWKEIVDCFGKGILNDDLTIDRQKLADIVFSNKEKLAKLNQIVLFEVARPVSVDKVIVVSASRQTQLRRLGEKGISRGDAQRRIESQLPLEGKIESADFVINNDGPLEETKRQVGEIYSALRKEKTHKSWKVPGRFAH
jgi:dephospho-CoA kinase